MTKDLYIYLGLDESASGKEIEDAYQSLSRQFGPESGNTDTESKEKFKKISEAYFVLSDIDRRAEYDIRGKISHRRTAHKSTDGLSVFRTRRIINRIFLCGAAISAVLFAIYISGGSPIPFYYVCGASLLLKIVEYILRLVQ
ncbi:MAG: DnaJ domain-containing protein [Bacteroidaceae bacterium]|nr:DnaJ domain-containing protein [Bacteroidaceae bacterium]